MLHVLSCEECGVPELFNQSHVWLNNGDIVQKANPRAHLCFIECDDLDPLLQNIGDIFGISVEHMIVNVIARATAAYMNQMIPKDVRENIICKQIDPKVLAAPILHYCHIVGYGKYEYLGSRYKRDADDYSKFKVTKPFSVPIVAGSIAGSLTAMILGEHEVTYKEVSTGVYEFTTSWTEYPEEMKEKIPVLPYDHRDGDIDLERCATCGGPKAFSSYRWDLDAGLVFNEQTGRRMVVSGPEALDHLFKALEEEIGETLPEVVVEAQRIFTKTRPHSVNEISDENNFRTQLALMGLGNLRQMKIDPGGLLMRIDNAAGSLMTVGKVQGIFELAFDKRSAIKWELSKEGDLLVEIIPLFKQFSPAASQ